MIGGELVHLLHQITGLHDGLLIARLPFNETASSGRMAVRRIITLAALG